MKVTLINPEESQKLHERWGQFARVCYNSPEGREAFIGKGCHNTGHYSGSRTTYFIFHIEGVSRALTAQLNRHSIGVVINEQSMRYVNFANAEVTMPPTIANNPVAAEAFNIAVEQAKASYNNILDALAEDGITGEMANQDARYVCNIGIQTEGMWAFTIEALEHFMHKRLCDRAQWEIRDMANIMRKAVVEVVDSPLVHKALVPHCMALGYCPENKMQCKKYKKFMPTKQQFDKIQKLPEFKLLVAQIKEQEELAKKNK